MLFIITFFLIFGWKYSSFLDISAIVGCILAGQYIYYHKPFSFLKKNPPFNSLLTLTIYSTIIVLFTEITDFMPILRSARALIMLISCFSLYNLYRKHYKNPIYKICMHIYISILIHGILMIVMYISTPFRLFVYSITEASSIVNLKSPFLQGYRICGLTYGLSQTSVLQMFAFLLLPFLFSNQRKIINKTLLVLSFPLIIISSILGGRSGLFITIIVFPIYVILKLITTKISLENFFKHFKFIIVCTISFLTLFYAAYHYLPNKFTGSNLRDAKEILTVFNNNSNSNTFKLVKPMYFLPNNICTTLVGLGNYGRTKSLYLASDVGWIKSIFAIGLIGTLFMLYPYLWGIFSAFKQRNYLGELAIAAILIFIFSILLNFKELALLTRNQWTIQAIIIAILSINNKKEQIEK